MARGTLGNESTTTRGGPERDPPVSVCLGRLRARATSGLPRGAPPEQPGAGSPVLSSLAQRRTPHPRPEHPAPPHYHAGKQSAGSSNGRVSRLAGWGWRRRPAAASRRPGDPGPRLPAAAPSCAAVRAGHRTLHTRTGETEGRISYRICAVLLGSCNSGSKKLLASTRGPRPRHIVVTAARQERRQRRCCAACSQPAATRQAAAARGLLLAGPAMAHGHVDQAGVGSYEWPTHRLKPNRAQSTERSPKTFFCSSENSG